MSEQSGLLKSSLSKKYFMAVSGLFLIVFLTQHFVINLTSVFSADAFNTTSHFMGTNPLIQFVIQPILIFGVIFHFVMGFVLEMKNRSARPQKYAFSNPAASSAWTSRYMILSGAVVFWFLALHFYDFWLPEINTKFIQGDMSGLSENGGFRYYEELVHKFTSPIRVGIYIIAFVFLALHLLHGFQSAFQSLGAHHKKYTPLIKKLGNLYAVLIPVGFAIIAIYHFAAH
jgi:succinate dehydrogenase / fumarate reductase cytochrome b subunit